MGASTLLVTILMVVMASNFVHSQFGTGHRNWFDMARGMHSECLPDGTECRRMSDCCSLHCQMGYNPPGVCEQSPCGCPQPVFASGPISEQCVGIGRPCGESEQCCSGCCFLSPYGNHCMYPPCEPCT